MMEDKNKKEYNKLLKRCLFIGILSIIPIFASGFIFSILSPIIALLIISIYQLMCVFGILYAVTEYDKNVETDREFQYYPED